ncbi:MAG: DNA primase [Polymorphobacter sp.]
MTLPPAFLDELRARVPLAPVVGRRVKLTRAGREWKGCCPFHNEKTPSFYVNDDKGFYHCFGCGAHGDVIRFLTEQEGLGFIDAVKQLALQAGIEVPSETPEARARAEVSDTLQSLAARASEWFQLQLRSPVGAAARDYLDRRNVTAAQIKDFALGFSPDSRTALKSFLKDAGEDALVEAGLLGRSDNGETYDRFRGRLMFPIRDRRGRVVGFGGRALGDVQPKYLNSADGPLFDKGRLLYNLDRAGPVAHKSGRLVVVEGYMDVIGVAGAGITELVAPLGTAMTEAQLGLAWRQVDEPILCFDGDGAGQRAALRACLRALPLLAPGKSLRIATLPPGEDPDDLVKRGGAPAFEAVLTAAIPLSDYLWRSEIEGVDTTTPERRAAVRSRLRELAALVADGTIRALYSQTFDERFQELFFRRVEKPDRVFVKGHYRSLPRTAGASPALRAMGEWLKHSRVEIRAILTGLILYPSVADIHGESVSALPLGNTVEGSIRDAILSILADKPDLESEQLEHHLADWGLQEAVHRISSDKHKRLRFSFTKHGASLDIVARDVGALLSSMFSRDWVERELNAATAALATTSTTEAFERQQALRKELMSFDSAMMRLAESMRGD